ncbi:SixA phosphatase family protein [Polaribacter gangjinensis]|uniref:Phosphoglycerate mutase n=1 Tax=Polaribacter gangjinensis TaxID=574710 RepID=A0A2S7WA32_9FLAO|nr:histidine phosphatase family protein [Polaribacter gangjinensis]PQJ74463.1 phosphoglycerate mutase [Polaribacter gangjinensis]
MKKLLILALIFCSFCQQETTTTYYLIRHAEKDRTDATNSNPDLNNFGIARAKKWASYFKNIPLDAVYSTNYKRTQQTAQPTADDKKLSIQSYNPRELYAPDFQKATYGKTVLIVGHSNTTPAFVNAILGEKKYEDMSDDDNGSLYVVTIIGNSKVAKIIKVE